MKDSPLFQRMDGKLGDQLRAGVPKAPFGYSPGPLALSSSPEQPAEQRLHRSLL
jgi:hypothetical protein